MNSILHDESCTTAPPSCLQYVCSTQIFIIITKLAIAAEDANVTSASAQLFHLLINGETENLLDSSIFARSLVDLVRKSRGIGDNGQADLVELLFEICAKIRADPDILPAWFYPERRQSPPTNESGEYDGAQPPRRSASTARQDQFPLFYLLVAFVHNDGSSGDFARTGLLYLIEATAKSQNLEKWMIESDLAPQMASGLGALYSRLSRTPASVPHADIFSSTPWANTSEEYTNNKHRVPGDFGENKSEQTHEDEPAEAWQSVNTFLSYLAFWQDTLNHCSSIEVADTLLDHFQILFVQQLLYPSLLESSDMDGGSTAAVVVHLYRILESLEQKQMLQRILDYLLSSQQKKQTNDRTERRPRMSFSRRKSMDKLAAMARRQEDPSPDLFNLLDLITMSLKSSRTQTNTAALKLMSVMLRKHHDLVFTTLFKMQPCTPVAQTREAFNQELILLFGAAVGIMDTPRIDQSYQALLEDGQFMLNEHPCGSSLDEDSLQSTAATPHSFEVREDCGLMENIRDLFRSFFSNDTMTNIAVTEVVMCLASCKVVTLRGWLIQSLDNSPGSATSSILEILENQVAQVRQWRGHFLKWDELFLMQQTKLIGAPASLSMSKSPTFDRPISPMALGISNASPRFKNRSSLRSSSADQSTNDSAISKDLEHLLQMPVQLPRAEEPTDLQPALPSLVERLSLEPRPMLSTTPSEGMSSGTATPSFPELSTRLCVTLGHVLTNAIILQEFILEIAAVVQIRASAFGEVETVSKV